MRAAVFWSYHRYSTKPQQWSDSERRQVEHQRRRASKLGIPFMEKYRDSGVSAFKSKNRYIGALGQFLGDLKSGPPDGTDEWPLPGDYLGVESFDRLCRDGTYEADGLMREIIDAGIVLMVRDRQFTRQILNTERGAYSAVINEMERAHEESVLKSERISEVKGEKRDAAIRGDGIFAGHTGPSWLAPNSDRSGYDLIADRVATVAEMFRLVLAR